MLLGVLVPGLNLANRTEGRESVGCSQGLLLGHLVIHELAVGVIGFVPTMLGVQSLGQSLQDLSDSLLVAMPSRGFQRTPVHSLRLWKTVVGGKDGALLEQDKSRSIVSAQLGEELVSVIQSGQRRFVFLSLILQNRSIEETESLTGFVSFFRQGAGGLAPKAPRSVEIAALFGGLGLFHQLGAGLGKAGEQQRHS